MQSFFDGEEDDDDEEAVSACDEETIIGADSHKPYWFDMSAGQELVASIAADNFIDIIICSEHHFDAWLNQDKDDLPKRFAGETLEFVAPGGGTFVVLLINWTGSRYRSNGGYRYLGYSGKTGRCRVNVWNQSRSFSNA